MTDSEYESLIAESKRLLDITSATRAAHTEACHNWNVVQQKVEFEKTRRQIVADYLKEQQELADLEAQYQLEQAQAAEMP